MSQPVLNIFRCSVNSVWHEVKGVTLPFFEKRDSTRRLESSCRHILRVWSQ